MEYTKWKVECLGSEGFQIRYDNSGLTASQVPIERRHSVATLNGSFETQKANAHLISAAPKMYEALKEATDLILVARQYFPKSIKNSDRFKLENTCSCISKAKAKAEGRL